jgi:hypothetical protein
MGVVFQISGVVLIRKLREYHWKYYMIVACKLWISAIVLSTSLILRGILTIVRYGIREYIRKVMNKSYKENNLFAPLYDTVVFIFIDMIPIWA